MNFNNLSVKELRAKARQKQAIECPSYSKMTKQELIQYLSGYRKTKAEDIIDSIQLTKKRIRNKKTLSLPQTRTLSLPQKQPYGPTTKHKYLVQQQENYPRPDSPNAPRFIRRTQAHPQKRTQRKRTQRKLKKSSDPYYLQNVFQENQKQYKQMPVHLKRSTQSEDLSSLRVVDLKQMLKQNKQKTSGKKSELIQRLKQYQDFQKARQGLQQKVRP